MGHLEDLEHRCKGHDAPVFLQVRLHRGGGGGYVPGVGGAEGIPGVQNAPAGGGDGRLEAG